MSGRALMVTAHPPGTGSGSAVRGNVALETLRERYEHVDVVSLAFESEHRFAVPGTILLDRPPEPTTLEQLRALPRGSAHYHAERAMDLKGQLRGLVAGGALAPAYDLVWSHGSLVVRAGSAVAAPARILDIDNVAAAALRQTVHDPPASIARRTYRRLSAAAVGIEERRRCASQTAVLVTSEVERRRLGRVRPPVHVVPNTVPDPGLGGRAQAPTPTLLFVGSLDYEPNVDAVLWLVDEVLPALRRRHRGAAVMIAGRRPAPAVREAAARAEATLVENPEDLTPLYRQAHVVLAPTRTGGGTGRIKLLEAMAHGAAVVATAQAVEGLAREDRAAIRVADGAEGFAEAVAAVLADPAAADELATRARRAWAERHSPEVARKVILGVLDGAA